MPLVRKLEPGLWEIRSSIPDGIARVIFTVEGGQMVILNGFAKRSARTPVGELRTARRRAANLRKE
jgi:phage-related protein